jgi:hypothetical protein
LGAFVEHFDGLYGKGAFEENPLVWVYDFSVVKPCAEDTSERSEAPPVKEPVSDEYIISMADEFVKDFSEGNKEAVRFGYLEGMLKMRSLWKATTTTKTTIR